MPDHVNLRRSLHPWDITPKQAIEIQKQLAQQVVIKDAFSSLETVAGIDVGFEEKNTIAKAAIVVLNLKSLDQIDFAIARRPVTFPYVPGLLAFREIPVILAALQQLSNKPEILLCDGQGIAHPRGLGIASHLGLITSIPSIGVAKTRLIGEHTTVGNAKGAWQALFIKRKQVGVVLRTRANTKPLYISPGHKVGIMSAMAITMNCVTKYRLPEATRQAHNQASKY